MRGGQWIKMLDNLKGNDTYSTTKEKAQDREEWKRIIGDCYDGGPACLRQKTYDDDVYIKNLIYINNHR